MTAGKTHSVPALERALQILEALAKSRYGLSLSQLTRYLNLPKSSVHCLLLTFERCGYLYREESSGRYRLGLRLCELGNMALNSIAVREQAAPLLAQLMERTGLTVHLGILEQGEGVLIEKLEPPGPYSVATWTGKRMAVHCTAIGKALIAHLRDEELDALIRKHGMLRHNDNTICSIRKLRQELALVREQGHAIDDEEEEIGVRCLGAPIFGPRGNAVAALSVVGTTAQIDAANLGALAGQVVATAKAISGRLRRLKDVESRAGEADD